MSNVTAAPAVTAALTPLLGAPATSLNMRSVDRPVHFGANTKGDFTVSLPMSTRMFGLLNDYSLTFASNLPRQRDGVKEAINNALAIFLCNLAYNNMLALRDIGPDAARLVSERDIMDEMVWVLCTDDVPTVVHMHDFCHTFPLPTRDVAIIFQTFFANAKFGRPCNFRLYDASKE